MAVTEDSEFWLRLSRRINDALRASRDNNIRFLWLDGFVPGTVLSQLEQDAVLAKAFVSEDGGRSFAHYRVRVHLSRSALEAYRKGEWTSLFPDPGSTGWLTISRANKEIQVRLVDHATTEAMMSFALDLSYSQIAVSDAVDGFSLNEWTPAHVAQGFAWRPGVVSFATLSAAGRHSVELLVGSGDVPILSSATRVIEVPFRVPESGKVAIMTVTDERQADLPRGDYGLRFEACPDLKIRFLFIKRENSEFRILRADRDLAPKDPLVKTASPAR
jgi:hypothetical protein